LDLQLKRSPAKSTKDKGRIVALKFSATYELWTAAFLSAVLKPTFGNVSTLAEERPFNWAWSLTVWWGGGMSHWVPNLSFGCRE